MMVARAKHAAALAEIHRSALLQIGMLVQSETPIILEEELGKVQNRAVIFVTSNYGN